MPQKDSSRNTTGGGISAVLLVPTLLNGLAASISKQSQPKSCSDGKHCGPSSSNGASNGATNGKA
jgi:hypothetical protein